MTNSGFNEIAVRGRSKLPQVRAIASFAMVGIFFLRRERGGDSGNLTRSDFDYSNLFQSQKQHSIHIEH